MKLKDGLTITTTDFWYDLTSGGCLNPIRMLVDKEDAKRVKDAIATIQEFSAACEKHIKGFYVIKERRSNGKV